MPKAKLRDDAVTVEKNMLETVVIQRSRFKGKDYVDARVWLMGVDGAPETPTKKGLTLAPEMWREVVLAVTEALGPELAEAAAEAA